MGQKMDPHGLRVGIIKDWDSKWYADKKDFANNLVEDDTIRKYIKKNLNQKILMIVVFNLFIIKKKPVGSPTSLFYHFLSTSAIKLSTSSKV